MSKNEEIVSFVQSNLALEGMTLSLAEKKNVMNCLLGKTTFDKEIKKVLAQYKRIAA